MGIIKKYHDKKWIIQFLDALYNSIYLLPLYNSLMDLYLQNQSI
jgi:hypothetical protein